ncbi:restriction endonuclease subunit S [Clostridium sp.]|uniref:restriction endonuclease subunit S n=1 Tax=Clostridium sp. TaxID=1506 RepID=UPI00307E2454
MSDRIIHPLRFKFIVNVISSGKSLPEQAFANEGYPVYGGGELIGFSKIANTDKGDILIGRVGARCGCVKYLNEKAWATDNALIIKTKNNSRFVSLLLEAANLNKIVSQDSTAQPLVTGGKIRELSMPFLTDTTEQQQIVHFLDRKCTAIDTAIEKTKKSIEKLEEYKKAVITKAVTKGIDPNAKMKDSGVEWIGEIPEGWKVTKTKYLFRILKRIAGREGFDVISITQKGLKIKDITSNEGQVAENYSNYQFVFPGDFAMNHMDLLTGWVDLSTLTGVTSPDYRVFHKINESVNDDYYKSVFQSLYFNKVYYGLAQGVAEVGRKRLQAPAFKELKLPCPPSDEPAKIAAYIKGKCMTIDALIEKKQTAINKWEEYKKSLIYYAVTGKIDCRNEVI